MDEIQLGLARLSNSKSEGDRNASMNAIQIGLDHLVDAARDDVGPKPEDGLADVPFSKGAGRGCECGVNSPCSLSQFLQSCRSGIEECRAVASPLSLVNNKQCPYETRLVVRTGEALHARLVLREIAGFKLVDCLAKLTAVSLGTARGFAEHLCTSSPGELADLRFDALAVGRNSCIANFHVFDMHLINAPRKPPDFNAPVLVQNS